MSKPRNSLKKSPRLVVICPYLCSSEHKQLTSFVLSRKARRKGNRPSIVPRLAKTWNRRQVRRWQLSHLRTGDDRRTTGDQGPRDRARDVHRTQDVVVATSTIPVRSHFPCKREPAIFPWKCSQHDSEI